MTSPKYVHSFRPAQSEALNSDATRKVKELHETKSMLRPSDLLNHRQVALLGHALRHPGHQYTIESHQTSHAVAYATARSDLMGLVRLGLLSEGRRGRKFIFQAPFELAERLKVLE